MDFVTASGKTRKEIVLNSAYKLVESIFDTSSNVSVGLIDFHGSSTSLYTASVRQKLTTDKSEMLTAINSQMSRSTSSGTNIAAGLKTAQKNFSNGAKNRVIILLTDGIPNKDVSGNNATDDVTSGTAITVQNNTKQTLLDLKSDGIYTITMLTGMSEDDGNTDKDGTETDVDINIENIVANDKTVVNVDTLPQTGENLAIVAAISILAVLSIVGYKQFKKLRGIK